MLTTNFFKIHNGRIVRVRKVFDRIYDHKGDEVNEMERGLIEKCPLGWYHEWLILPYEEGQKEYVKCLKCGEISHL